MIKTKIISLSDRTPRQCNSDLIQHVISNEIQGMMVYLYTQNGQGTLSIQWTVLKIFWCLCLGVYKLPHNLNSNKILSSNWDNTNCIKILSFLWSFNPKMIKTSEKFTSCHTWSICDIIFNPQLHREKWFCHHDPLWQNQCSDVCSLTQVFMSGIYLWSHHRDVTRWLQWLPYRQFIS